MDDLPQTNNTLDVDNSKKTIEIRYISHLDELQRKAYQIAKDHLKTTFDLERSNGFSEWKATFPK